jgi:2-(1,2-epoxy-1,2-dihydrophenyl)acetyl-CoA isomerase
MSTQPDLLTERREGVLIITLNRPDHLNALTEEMRWEMRDLLREVQANSSVRAVVLTGAGRAFCS